MRSAGVSKTMAKEPAESAPAATETATRLGRGRQGKITLTSDLERKPTDVSSSPLKSRIAGAAISSTAAAINKAKTLAKRSAPVEREPSDNSSKVESRTRRGSVDAVTKATESKKRKRHTQNDKLVKWTERKNARRMLEEDDTLRRLALDGYVTMVWKPWETMPFDR
jgi:hypothetical protein